VAALPPAFREELLLSAEAGYRVVLRGRMDRVWRRSAWLWPFFWLLAYANILFPETGNDIPASMVITAGRDKDGQPYHSWRRTFNFKTRRRFNATMIYDQRLRRVVEKMGPGGMFRMAWDVQFKAPGTLLIDTTGCLLRLGPIRVWLPDWLCVSVRAVQQTRSGQDNLVSVELTVSHPMLGPLFGYEGTFALERRDEHRHTATVGERVATGSRPR
jgi:hypothetical protein